MCAPLNYTAKLMDYRHDVYAVLHFASPQDLEAANAATLDASNGLYWLQHDEQLTQCECCECLFDVRDMVLVGRHQCCSDYCADDLMEKINVGRIEAAMEFKCYGNDQDSWYR
jgi:hypothetical protein